jgi:hypothetical protein
MGRIFYMVRVFKGSWMRSGQYAYTLKGNTIYFQRINNIQWIARSTCPTNLAQTAGQNINGGMLNTLEGNTAGGISSAPHAVAVRNRRTRSNKNYKKLYFFLRKMKHLISAGITRQTERNCGNTPQ